MIIWGRKGYSDFLGYIRHACAECGTDGIFEVHQLRKKFTLYFVPTFTYSNTQYIVCRACGTAYQVPKSLKRSVAENLVTREELARAIRQENWRRNSVEGTLSDAYGNQPALASGPAYGDDGVSRYCIRCGTKLISNAEFCHACGASVPEDLDH